MAKRAGKETLAAGTYEELRFRILNGRLSPGERLKPGDLAQSFGVSFGVMREALGLLAAQGLVQIDPNRSCTVTPLSLEALANLTASRKIIEGAALRFSVERGGVAWEADLLAAHHRMDSEPVYLPDDPSSRNERWAVAHIAFHAELIAACENSVLLEICKRLSDAAELYRAWSGQGARESKRDIPAEHETLLKAALAHDVDSAVACFEAHLDRTQADIILTKGDMDTATVPTPFAPDGLSVDGRA